MVYTYPQKVRKILRIAIPSAANSLLDIIVLALGMAFMGRFGQEYLVALSVSTQFIMLFFALNAVFYVGTNAQISRLYGARDSQSARLAFSTLITLCLLCSAPIIALAFLLISPFIAWMKVSSDSSALIEIFLLITIWSIPAMLLRNIIVSAFAAIGDTLSVFIVRIFSTGFCIGANIVLIFGLELDIVGAALSGVLTYVLELGVFAWLVWKKGRFFFESWRLALEWRYVKAALRIGIPAGFERFLTLGSLVLTTKFIASFGDLAVAGSQIGMRIEAFVLMPGFGFMVAAMALTGQNLGAGRIQAAMDLHKTILQIASIIMGVLGVLIAVFAIPLSEIFYRDEQVAQIALWYLIAVGFSQVPLVVVFVLDGVLRGAGITKLSLALNACSVWGFRILPIWLGIWCGLGVWWVFVMIFIETYIRAFVFYLAYKKGVWKKQGRF